MHRPHAARKDVGIFHCLYVPLHKFCYYYSYRFDGTRTRTILGKLGSIGDSRDAQTRTASSASYSSSSKKGGWSCRIDIVSEVKRFYTADGQRCTVDFLAESVFRKDPRSIHEIRFGFVAKYLQERMDQLTKQDNLGGSRYVLRNGD